MTQSKLFSAMIQTNQFSRLNMTNTFLVGIKFFLKFN